MGVVAGWAMNSTRRTVHMSVHVSDYVDAEVDLGSIAAEVLVSELQRRGVSAPAADAATCFNDLVAELEAFRRGDMNFLDVAVERLGRCVQDAPDA